MELNPATISAIETTAKLDALLRERHTGQHWAFVQQVPDGTGSAKGRTADALAMGLWPSKGLHLHGFEVKATRPDWQREIADPSKAEAFARFCDYFWVVAAPGVCEPSELPGSWGLLSPTKMWSSLKAIKGADRNRHPEPIDRAFLAALFRTVTRESPAEELMRQIWRRGHDSCNANHQRCEKQRTKRDRQYENSELQNLKTAVDDFEKASGVQIASYRGKRIGEAVSVVLNGGFTGLADRVGHTLNSVQRALDELREAKTAAEQINGTRPASGDS